MNTKMPLLKVVNELSKLPGIGEKTATRLAFHILKSPQVYAHALSEAIRELKEKIKLCSVCFDLTERDLCGICADLRRSKATVCVVEEPQDLLAVEKTRVYDGQYHILHGTLSPICGIGPDQLKIRELIERLRDSAVHEIILATNPTVEGEATALYLIKLLRPFPLKLTRIAHGVPTGGDLEYIDAVTIGNAIKNRVTI
ncbi:MAG: recombination protein RecR [Deltaproteobacteria bacterium]|nr:recombination protein RecR [Deltaproteobacteria bacterium]